MLLTTTKLSMPFQVLGLYLHLIEIFFLGLGVRLTSAKTRLKNIKNVSQKACKQGRDDIIVIVNLQSPIPTSVYITVAN